jgi:hypothetical protein
MDFVLPAALAAIVLAAAFLGLRHLGAAPGKGERAKATGPGGGLLGTGSRDASARVCPLCHSLLGPGERVKSDMLPGKGDRMMRIYGCPHCWPATEGATRTCPVCGEALAAGSWAVARYFEKPGRRHVHVLGCDRCRSPRKNGI